MLVGTGESLVAQGFEIVAGGPGDDRGVFVHQTRDGGFVAVGTTQGQGEDLYLVRTDAKGQILWTSGFGGAGTDWGWSVHETSDGYVVAGSTDSAGAGGFDCWVIGIDRQGKRRWDTTSGGRSDDRCWAMVPADDGGWLIVGETSRAGKGTEDCYLVRVDTWGKELWTAALGGEKSDRCFSVAVSATGWVVAGATFSQGNGDRDLWVAAVDAKGKLLWEKTWGGPESDVAHWIASTRDANFLITAYTSSLATSGDDPMLVKISPEGEEIWSRVLPYDAVVHAITGVETASGEFCLTGFENNGASRSALLIGVDADGKGLWTERIRSTSGDSFGYGVQPTADGGCVMTGHTTEGSYGGQDLLLVKRPY